MQIHVQRGAEELGVFTPEETTKYLAEGRLLESDLAWHDGLNDWTPLGGLIRQFGAARVWPARDELKTKTGGNTMTDKMTPTDDPSEDILKEYGDADGELSDQDKVALIGEAYAKMRTQISKMIIGQDEVVENLLTCIFAGGHCLLVGVPGLAKTLLVTTLSEVLDLDFKRIQFTPDLMPSDITGTDIIQDDPVTRERVYKFMPGPIFANIILADEINRAPAKVQSALLEAMQERQITIGDNTFKLENPFLVMATQNPIEQEGTYPLPEAQIDRFMFKVLVGYPNPDEELEILKRMGKINSTIDLKAVVKPEQIISARKIVDKIYIAENIQKYIVSLVFATRYPEQYGLKDLKSLISFGASPRATIFLANASKSHAFLNNRGFVIPEDVRSVGTSILRHRIILSYEAEAEEITTEDIIQRIYESVPTP